MTGLLEGKVALVTGAASGIGRAIAIRFAEEGARVVLADRQCEPREGGPPTDDLLRDRGLDARFVPCDVIRPAEVEAALDECDLLGGVDVLVNNAGLFRRHDFLALTLDEYDEVMDVNVKAGVFTAQAAARRMVARGAGSIVNMSSVGGLRGSASFAVYCASKGAVRLLTYALAVELGPKGVRVNAIHPGLIETAMTEQDAGIVGTELGAAYLAQIPAGRIGTAADVAEAAVFLASDRSSYVNGESLRVDGGILPV